MSWIEKIVIYQYLAPLFAVTIIMFYSEKNVKTHASRDEEELAGRVAAAFYALIIFSFIQAVIRTQ